MAHSSSRPYTTAVLLDEDQGVLRCATCPMCHTPTSVTQNAIEAGGEWRCVRCGQHWDASRLAAITRYTAWVADFDRVGRRGTESSQGAALYPHSPTERLGGTP
jgi:transcription elongation factor Elf1